MIDGRKILIIFLSNFTFFLEKIKVFHNKKTNFLLKLNKHFDFLMHF